MPTEYKIRMGLSEMAKYWTEMNEKQANGKLSKSERALFGKVKKALRLLRANPHHLGLNSHEIGVLSKREKFRVFESYLENNTPAAGRVFWTYGPGPFVGQGGGDARSSTKDGEEDYEEEKVKILNGP